MKALKHRDLRFRAPFNPRPDVKVKPQSIFNQSASGIPICIVKDGSKKLTVLPESLSSSK